MRDSFASGLDRLLRFERKDRMPVLRYLVLQHHDRVDHHFWARWASRNIDVDRNDLVDALHDRVVAVEPAARRARAERHHPFRIAHLVVDALEDRRFLVTHGADDHEQIGLSRGEAGQRRAESVGVVQRGAHRHEFHAAAGRHERIGKETELPDPADELVLLGRHVLQRHRHSNPPSLQRYTNASTSALMKNRNDTSDTVASSRWPDEPAQMNSSTVSMSNRRKKIATG